MNSQIRLRKNRRRKQEKKLVVFSVIMALAVIIGAGVTILSSQRNHLDKLEGLWIYDSVTSYEFSSDNNGVMHVSEQNYNFSYKLKGNKLNIDFDSQSVHDCVYKINIEEDVLTIEGKRGTTGGIYELVKKDLD